MPKIIIICIAIIVDLRWYQMWRLLKQPYYSYIYLRYPPSQFGKIHKLLFEFEFIFQPFDRHYILKSNINRKINNKLQSGKTLFFEHPTHRKHNTILAWVLCHCNINDITVWNMLLTSYSAGCSFVLETSIVPGWYHSYCHGRYWKAFVNFVVLSSVRGA